MHVKKNDDVIVLTGKDKGKSGKIVRAFPKLGQVVIDGINIKKIHEKKGTGGKGQIVERAYPIDASNVRLKK
ncbi:50S ribosomal protein L24 [Candidatus Parcubacteria bacterium]|nr:50S ribosomal protein L24 [Candidatus Parcubacteria bacterium]